MRRCNGRPSQMILIHLMTELTTNYQVVKESGYSPVLHRYWPRCLNTVVLRFYKIILAPLMNRMSNEMWHVKIRFKPNYFWFIKPELAPIYTLFHIQGAKNRDFSLLTWVQEFLHFIWTRRCSWVERSPALTNGHFISRSNPKCKRTDKNTYPSWDLT